MPGFLVKFGQALTDQTLQPQFPEAAPDPAPPPTSPDHCGGCLCPHSVPSKKGTKDTRDQRVINRPHPLLLSLRFFKGNFSFLPASNRLLQPREAGSGRAGRVVLWDSNAPEAGHLQELLLLCDQGFPAAAVKLPQRRSPTPTDPTQQRGHATPPLPSVGNGSSPHGRGHEPGTTTTHAPSCCML